MNQQKKKRTGPAAVLTGAVLFLLLTLCVFGCSARSADAALPQEELAKMSLEEAAPETVKSFLTLYSSCDTKSGEYVSGMEGVQFPGLQAAIAKSLNYKIGEVRMVKNDDGTQYAVVETTIETVSFRTAYEAALKEIPENADSETILDAVQAKLEKFSNSKRETFTSELIVLDFITTRKIQPSSELSDALTGGMMRYISEQVSGGVSE